jgi:hypothetical protein
MASMAPLAGRRPTDDPATRSPRARPYYPWWEPVAWRARSSSISR